MSGGKRKREEVSSSRPSKDVDEKYVDHLIDLIRVRIKWAPQHQERQCQIQDTIHTLARTVLAHSRASKNDTKLERAFIFQCQSLSHSIWQGVERYVLDQWKKDRTTKALKRVKKLTFSQPIETPTCLTLKFTTQPTMSPTTRALADATNLFLTQMHEHTLNEFASSTMVLELVSGLIKEGSFIHDLVYKDADMEPSENKMARSYKIPHNNRTDLLLDLIHARVEWTPQQMTHRNQVRDLAGRLAKEITGLSREFRMDGYLELELEVAQVCQVLSHLVWQGFALHILSSQQTGRVDRERINEVIVRTTSKPEDCPTCCVAQFEPITKNEHVINESIIKVNGIIRKIHDMLTQEGFSPVMIEDVYDQILFVLSVYNMIVYAAM